MTYSVQNKKFMITQSELDQAANSLLWAMKQARILAKEPLCKRKRDGGLKTIDHLEKGIIDAGKNLGLDFGSDWGDQIDLSNI